MNNKNYENKFISPHFSNEKSLQLNLFHLQMTITVVSIVYECLSSSKI